MKRQILIACDHGGVALKRQLKEAFGDAERYEWIDLGCEAEDGSVDYPDYARKLADAMAEGQAGTGVLICGSGIGISIAANRHAHVRAALCTDVTMAKLSRQHNDANVLALGARLIGDVAAIEILKTFLETEFEGERHARRVTKMS